jgi:hypothetical protein
MKMINDVIDILLLFHYIIGGYVRLVIFMMNMEL